MAVARWVGAGVVLAVAALAWWSAHRPADPPGVARPSCVSFAPFRDGQSPLAARFPTEEQVAADLDRLSTLTSCVRVYGSLGPLGRVPALAEARGMEVVAGAWLGSDPLANELELKALVELANAHPRTIRRVIVGNEVLLRRDLSPTELIAAIRRVRAAIDQPVGYADVWGYWLRHPEVAPEVDFLAIHVLPYWDDEPRPASAAPQRLRAVVARVRAAFPGRPVWIGETGWPTAGRPRGSAVPSRASAATLLRALPALEAELGLQINVVEAFDQGWKSWQEGTVGARWGILDADREPKGLLAGPVDESPTWPAQGAASLLLGAALWALTGRAGGRPPKPPHPGLELAHLALCQALSALVVLAVVEAWSVAITPGSRAAVGALIASFAALAVQLAATAARSSGRLHLPGDARPATLADPRDAAMLGAAFLALLVTDRLGRYTDIPVAALALPAVGGLLAGLVRRLRGVPWSTALALGGLADPLPLDPATRARFARAMAAGLLVAAAFSLLVEGLSVRGEDFAVDHPALTGQIHAVLAGTVANGAVLAWASLLALLALLFEADAARCRARSRRSSSAAGGHAPHAPTA